MSIQKAIGGFAGVAAAANKNIREIRPKSSPDVRYKLDKQGDTHSAIAGERAEKAKERNIVSKKDQRVKFEKRKAAMKNKKVSRKRFGRGGK